MLQSHVLSGYQRGFEEGNFSALETSFPRHCHTIWKEHLSFEVWRGKAASAIFPVKVSVIAFSPFIIPARIEGVTSRLGPSQTYSNWNPELQWNWWRNAFTAYGGHDHRAWHFCTFLLPFFNFPSRPTMMISSPGNSSKRCTSRLCSFVLIIISYPAMHAHLGQYIPLIQIFLARNWASNVTPAPWIITARQIRNSLQWALDN
jgi:hypothetical protein